MNVRRLVIPLALVIVLALVVTTVVALAQSPPGQPGCGMRAGAGCGMGAGGGCGMRPGGGMGMGRGCGMRMGGGCGMMAMGRGRGAATTRALASGQVTLAATPRGLLLLVADKSHQGDANASVSATGSGPGKDVGLKAERIGAGRFALQGDVSGVSEIAVRVTKGAISELVYFGVPTRAARGGGCSGGGAGCKCGDGCKCASGDRSACKCGTACKCGACGKQGAAAQCGAGCKCARCGGQK